MAHMLKLVDNTPICDPSYARRIDPVWMSGKVPSRFWQDGEHRRDYLVWAASRVGFHSMKDIYRLNLVKIYRRFHGSGLVHYWRTSALVAAQDCFPLYDWKPWLFTMVPNGFWDLPANRQSYLNWLGKELGFRRLEDWYRIQGQVIAERRGGVLLNRYGSLYDLMREFLPQLDWDRVDVHRQISVKEISKWADDHYARHGTWPTNKSGEIPATEYTWSRIGKCLWAGRRGLPKCTLARFLAEHRGVLDGLKPPLSEDQILAWADAHFAEHGDWPKVGSGPIAGTRETWHKVDDALKTGHRGLKRKSSLAQLLTQRRGVRNGARLPPLNVKQILAWADAHFAKHGKWPNNKSGPIPGSFESWQKIDGALGEGLRGLRGNSSLAKLLAKQRGVRNRKALPPYKVHKILVWAKEHFKSTGKWPVVKSGPISLSSTDSWASVDQALRFGGRGLPGNSSLDKLLRKHGLK